MSLIVCRSTEYDSSICYNELLEMETPDLKKEFGAAVKRERNRQGISQETLAERADLHRTYVTDVERGTRNLSLESIRRLAEALGTSIGALFAATADQGSSAVDPGARDPANQIVDLLLVEDDPLDIELTLEAFKAAGLTNRMLIVRDGAAALDFLFCEGEYAHRRVENRPQVVLLDLNLPKVHGLEVLRRIKADERTRMIRVVVLTASRKDENIHDALRLGAEAYIAKPVDFQNFSEVTPKLSFHWTLHERPAGDSP